ncbi:hypothetical protein SK803_01980 [Lentzea sp. BCCO 10_0856]|uniref:Membrane-associated oxidoreductase n=1 Tax=Lentzea miocenica TaxID=3095431 RepID=A0ABU4SSU2_9PSEU|nr:hypothetical protein [Lentzea sp. BCCO 10_0856]MDX8028956.1 hypothetical protein [Lentzea sp. BCCO 10_0856]
MNLAEIALIQFAAGGLELDCAKLPPPSTSDGWHHVQATLVSRLLDGTFPVHHRGVRLRNARIVTSGREPLCLDRLRSDVGLRLKDCLLDCAIWASDARLPWLEVNGCELPELLADRISVAGSVYLRGLRTTTAGSMGTVRLLGADIGHNLELDGSRLHNLGVGPGLHAEGLRVGRAFRFRHGNVSTRCDTGAIQLVNARVEGDLWLDGTVVRNVRGPALNAEGLRVEGSLMLSSGFEARAMSDELATVHLMSASIGARLDLGEGRATTGLSYGRSDDDRTRTHAVLENTGGKHLTLDLKCARVNELRLPDETVCTSDQDWCGVDDKVVLVGLKYNSLSQESMRPNWPHWLSTHAEPFDSEPFQHLATIMRDAGKAGRARKVLIALEEERFRRRYRPSWGTRCWHVIKRVFTGHGYKPGRALAGLLAVVGVAVVFTLIARANGWISRPALLVEGLGGDGDGIACSTGDAIRLAADLSIPLINTSGRLRCDFEHYGLAQQIGTVAGIVLQILGWAFATLFVAGFSGAVRKI